MSHFTGKYGTKFKNDGTIVIIPGSFLRKLIDFDLRDYKAHLENALKGKKNERTKVKAKGNASGVLSKRRPKVRGVHSGQSARKRSKPRV